MYLCVCPCVRTVCKYIWVFMRRFQFIQVCRVQIRGQVSRLIRNGGRQQTTAKEVKLVIIAEEPRQHFYSLQDIFENNA